ncbi:MAG: hypothetical protein J5965_12200 [Aeriscardovia sp.]|nr:hypothetical protein [Aeriscardovia sp.]
MRIINADKFLTYLIFSKHIDGLTCGEVKEAIEMCKVDILDNIRAEIETKYGQCDICEYFEDYDYEENDISEYRPIGNIADILQIIDKYKAEKEQNK